MEKLSRYKENREMLKALSQQVKPLVKSGQYDFINEALIDCIYKQEGHEEFNTLPQWNKKGYRVKRGSRAFVVWGSPKEVSKEQQAEQGREAPENEEDDKENFWPLCYLFSNLQVEPAQARKEAA
jgi:hypothetical protein